MRVLIVCTGNICRSPVIEAVLRERFPEWDVSSAGTRAAAGRPVHMLTSLAMTEAGLQAGHHSSRPVDRAVLDGVDLVVTAEKAHRSTVLSVRPDLLRRTFTLDELTSLAEAVRPLRTDGRADEALLDVVAERGRHPVTPGDLSDPVDAGLEAHHQMVREVVRTVDRLAGSLLAAPPFTDACERAPGG